jgi:outer membrane protein assembly factor BamB
MHRTLFPKIQVFVFFFAVSTAFAQSRASGEVDPSRCWSYGLDDFAISVSVENSHALLAYATARVESISLNGNKSWTTELGGETRSNIYANDANVFVVTSTSTTDKTSTPHPLLRVLSKDTGITVRTQKLEPADRYFLNGTGSSLVIVSSAGKITRTNAGNGAPEWEHRLADGFVGEPVFSKDKVIVASKAEVFVVSLAAGSIDLTRKVPFGVSALGQTLDAELIVGDERGNVFLFAEAAEQPEWRFKSGGSISKVMEADGNVLSVSNDNFVYLINDRDGGVIWKKRLPGRIAATAVYQDSYVVVAGIEEHAVVVLDSSKGKVAGQIKLADEETVTAIQPAASGVLILSNKALYLYGLTDCGKK